VTIYSYQNAQCNTKGHTSHSSQIIPMGWLSAFQNSERLYIQDDSKCVKVEYIFYPNAFFII